VLVFVLGLGALVNFASSSEWERFGWGPFSLVLCTMSLVLARSRFVEQPRPPTEKPAGALPLRAQPE
jgi:hypothetical protein